jgi:hypothetical protein
LTLSPKALSIIIKDADIGDRWELLKSIVDGLKILISERRLLFIQIVRMLDSKDRGVRDEGESSNREIRSSISRSHSIPSPGR